MEEVWKDIYYYNPTTDEYYDYRGLYQVSNLGRVKSLERFIQRKNGRVIHIKERILVPYKSRKGYLFVNLKNKGKNKIVPVHRIVGHMFIDNPHNYKEINHKSEVKTENSVENLEWCDTKYNINYGEGRLRGGLRRRKPIIEIDCQGNIINEYDSQTSAAALLKLSRSFISNVLHGRGRLKNNHRFIFK